MEMIRSTSIFQEVGPIYQEYQEDLSIMTLNYLHKKFLICRKESFSIAHSYFAYNLLFFDFIFNLLVPILLVWMKKSETKETVRRIQEKAKCIFGE